MMSAEHFTSARPHGARVIVGNVLVHRDVSHVTGTYVRLLARSRARD
jgi:hypothetical protein